jgi:zinc transporter
MHVAGMGQPDAVESGYGSDRTGLVWAFRFAPGEPAHAVQPGEIADLVLGGSAAPGGQFLWLHFSLSNAASERWLRQHLELPNSFHLLLHEGVGSTRVEQDGESLLAIIHDVLFDSSFDTTDVSTVALCVQPRVLVSARPRPLRSLDRLRSTVRGGAMFRSPAELLAQLLRDQANVLVEIVRHTTSRVDTAEDRLLANRIAMSRAELGSMRRVLVRLQRLLAPEPAALFRLLSRPPRWIGEEDVQDLRQSAEEFSTAVADSATLVERIRLLQEELAARINEQNNRILFVLTVVTVLAVPFNLIGGLFGMNVGGIPFADDRRGFWLIIALVSAFTAAAGAVIHRRRGG